MSILFADDINFHARGFPELFSYLKTYNIQHAFHGYGNRGLKNSYGRYDPEHKDLQPYISRLRDVPVCDWPHMAPHGINLYDMARYEIMSQAMLQPHWYDNITANSPLEIFGRLLEKDYQLLLLNLAAAWFWVEHWNDFFSRQHTKPIYFCVFGNALIYARTGVFCAHKAGILPYAFEHILTGRHHFMEPRLSPIQGNTSLRLKIPAFVETDRAKVSHMFGTMKNKNVAAAKFCGGKFFSNNEKTVLLLAQVLNDFSLIVDNNPTIGSIAAYKSILAGLLTKTACNVIIKTHPYEYRKLHGDNVTHDELQRFIHTLPAAQQQRIRLVCDHPLADLFLHSDCAVTISSQSGLEALYHGIPTCLISDAFYVGHGFTHDFTSPDQFVTGVVDGTAFHLDEAMREKFYKFMSWTLCHLISAETPAEKFRFYFADAATAITRHSATINSAPKNETNTLPAPLRKLRKLVRNPSLYFEDARKNREQRKKKAAA